MSSDEVSTESLLASQRTYYDLRADDYMDESKPSDRKHRSYMTADEARAIVDDFAPTGDVLELACGTGVFTHEIVRHATSVTAVDGSPRMLARNREEVGDPKVTYVESDIFAWEPDRAYDAVCFGFWLSHVPPAAFDDFWILVRRCLRPDGRVLFIDEDDRGAVNEHDRSDDVVAERRLSDGRAFEIVKIFWNPDDLESRLRSSGWDIDVRRLGETFLYGVGRPAED